MGIGDLVNSGLGEVGEVVDGGRKLAGEFVKANTDAAGQVLDTVGANGLADKVEDYGDRIASELGATPGERQLGDSDEPKDLVHGDAKAIRAAAKHLTDFFTAFDKVGDGMRRLNSSSWQGEAAEAFRRKFAMHPTKWLQAADACDAAGKALSSYADTVEWAQGQARDAIDLYQRGAKASEQAAGAYNKKVDAYNAAIKADQDPGPPLEQFKDPGRSDTARAHEVLDEARRQRDDAGSAAASAVREALAHAPAEPPPLTRLKADAADGFQAVNTEILHFDAGVVKGTAGILNFARGLNPMDPYNITHPAAYVQNVNMTLAGLVSTAAHPERAAKTMLDDFMKDPSEGTGRLFPNLIGDGAGLEAGLARLTAKEGLESAAEQTVLKQGTDVAEKSAADTAKSNPEKYDTPNPSEKVKEDPSDPIDLSTGRMYLPQTDLTLPGVLPLVFKRRVESGYRFGRWFGPSWSSTLDQRLEIDSEGVVLVSEDGLLLAYPHPARACRRFPAMARAGHWTAKRAATPSPTRTSAVFGISPTTATTWRSWNRSTTATATGSPSSTTQTEPLSGLSPVPATTSVLPRRRAESQPSVCWQLNRCWCVTATPMVSWQRSSTRRACRCVSPTTKLAVSPRGRIPTTVATPTSTTTRTAASPRAAHRGT